MTSIYPTTPDLSAKAAIDEELQTIPVRQIARLYNISERTLRDHARRGKLKVIRLGRFNHVTMASLRRYLAGTAHDEKL